ncbi:MAG: YCF48-related protein [Desulfobacterales bacterium]|nr:YCF48-related protein [Desulfobacterales bacterium]
MMFLPPVGKAQESLPPDLENAKLFLNQNINFREKFYDAAAINGSAWLVGYYGTILHVTENMTQFERQDSGTKEPLLSVSFADGNNGVIVGTRGLILKTADGGKTWTKIKTEFDKHLFAVAFGDVNNGWAVGEFGTILHTADGGNSWQAQSLEGIDVTLYGCYFLDAMKGVVVGEFEVILSTVDGGVTWQTIQMNDTDGVALCDVLFKTPEEGIAVGQNGVLLQTQDGGVSWERTKLPISDNLLGIGVMDDTIFVVGLRGVMLEKAASGEFELNKTLGISGWLQCVVGSKKGPALIAGDHGRILWSGGGEAKRKWIILN